MIRHANSKLSQKPREQRGCRSISSGVVAGITVSHIFAPGLRNENCRVRWTGGPQPIDGEERHSFCEVQRHAENGNLLLIDGRFFIWEFSPEVFNAMESITILTYQLEGSFLYPYLQLHGLHYDKSSVVGTYEDGFALAPYRVDMDQRKEWKRLITLYQDNKVPDLGKLSATWYKSSVKDRPKSNEATELKCALRRFFSSVQAKPCDIMWSCPKDSRNSIAPGGYCNGDLTLTNCQFSGDEVENKMYGTDILSLGTLSITDEQVDGAGYYEESTGQKVTLPLTDHANVAKLIYLTDEQAAEYFAPEEPDNPDDTEDNEQNGGEDNSNPDEPDEGEPDNPAETPSDPPEQPDNGEDGDTPIEPEEPPTTPEEPQDKPDSSDDDYEPPVYRPVRPTKPVEPEPQPAPALICNNAVIDTSRSAKLQGYGDGLLHEDDSLSRAQMATIVYRLLDDESVAALSAPSSSFTDVDADAWYAPSVLALADAGVVGGTGNGYFAPDSPTTWAQLLTVLGRFVEQQECALQHIRYDGWARPAIETAIALGWIDDSAEIVPDDVITRGEAVDLINMVLKQYR